MTDSIEMPEPKYRLEDLQTTVNKYGDRLARIRSILLLSKNTTDKEKLSAIEKAVKGEYDGKEYDHSF